MIRAAFLALLAAIAFPLALSAQPKRTPLIIVPGVQGSKLCDGDEVVWGDLGSIREFRRLDLNTEQGDRLKPCGLIDKIKMIGPLGIDVYRPFLEVLQDTAGYREGESLFTFDYDWRRSNFDCRKIK